MSIFCYLRVIEIRNVWLVSHVSSIAARLCRVELDWTIALEIEGGGLGGTASLGHIWNSAQCPAPALARLSSRAGIHQSLTRITAPSTDTAQLDRDAQQGDSHESRFYRRKGKQWDRFYQAWTPPGATGTVLEPGFICRPKWLKTHIVEWLSKAPCPESTLS